MRRLILAAAALVFLVLLFIVKPGGASVPLYFGAALLTVGAATAFVTRLRSARPAPKRVRTTLSEPQVITPPAPRPEPAGEFIRPEFGEASSRYSGEIIDNRY